MKNTSNYNLKKPEGNDKIDIDDFNYNADIIDSELKKLNNKNISLDADIKTSNYGQITDSQDNLITLTNGYNGIANLDIKGNTLVNLIQDSSFSKGTTWWGSDVYCTLTVTNNIIASKATVRYGGTMQYIARTNAQSFANHKLYFRAYIKPTTDNPDDTYLLLNDGTDQELAPVGKSSIFTLLSGIRTISPSAKHIYFKIQDGRTSGWDEISMKEPIVIDLTSMYGAGNEPSKEWCDTNIPYFEGMKSVDKIEVLSRGKNLFNKNKIQANKYVDMNNGNIVDTSLNIFCSDYIEIKPNTQYIRTLNSGNQSAWYDANKIFISGFGGGNAPITSPANAKFIRITSDNQYLNVYQLEEGTTATTYEEYKEDKINILTTLKRISDSIYDYVNKDGLITRNCKEIILNGSTNEVWEIQDDNKGDVIGFAYKIFDDRKNENGNIISDRFNCIPPTLNTECIYAYSGSYYNYIYIYIKKTKLTTIDTTGFKTWLSSNNVTAQYQLATPTQEQIQPLQLNSYNNGSLVVNGNIPPYVSAKYPQNIGADLESYSTVDIGRINDDNLSFPIYNNINDSSDTVFSLDDVNTGIADISVKGNTLVNLVSVSTHRLAPGYIDTPLNLKLMKPDTLYTLIQFDNTGKVTSFQVSTGDEKYILLNKTTTNLVTFATPSNFDVNKIGVNIYSNSINNSFVNGDETKINYVLLEGDYSKNPPQEYFEGMRSVSNVDVLSRGKNLLNINKNPDYVQSATYSIVKNVITITGDRTLPSSSIQWNIKVKPNTRYTFYSNSTRTGTTGGGVYIASIANNVYSELVNLANQLNPSATFLIPSNANKIAIVLYGESNTQNGTSATYSNVQLEESSIATNYEEYKGDKIKILSPIRRINDSIYDSINKDGLISRSCKEIILNGSETFVKESWDTTNTITFAYNVSDRLMGNLSYDSIKCDKFVTMNRYNPTFQTLDTEGIALGGTGEWLEIKVFKSKLSTQDIAGFKTWLASNNIKVIYQLATPTQEQIQPLQLSCFDNGSIAVNSVIPPYISVKYPTNKASALESYANIKVGQINSKLDENISKTKIVQDTADMAKDISDIANSTAKTAKNTADSAISTSNTAKSTADTANSTANTANATANNAISVANTAKSTADTAVSTANQANTTANAGYTLASNAVPKSGNITMGGVLAGYSNNQYAVKQLRNVILSANDADINQLGLGDIWIKYK